MEGRYEGTGKWSHVIAFQSEDALRLEDWADDPSDAVALLRRWQTGPFDKLPEGLAWLPRVLESRTPILTRTDFGEGRVYFRVHFVPFGFSRLDAQGPPVFLSCPSADGVFPPRESALSSLSWLALHFGTLEHRLEESGTAPFGRPLDEFVQAGATLVTNQNLTELADAELVYELDGDVLATDVHGELFWCGQEWGDGPPVGLGIDLDQALPFIVWSFFRGVSLQPSDFSMLHAAISV